MKQRGAFSVSTLILFTLQERPLTKTRLMQELVLNYNRINRYCDQLLCQGLIKHEPATHRYTITTKGSQVLKLSQELASLLPPVEQMIEKYSIYTQGYDPENFDRFTRIV